MSKYLRSVLILHVHYSTTTVQNMCRSTVPCTTVPQYQYHAPVLYQYRYTREGCTGVCMLVLPVKFTWPRISGAWLCRCDPSGLGRRLAASSADWHFAMSLAVAAFCPQSWHFVAFMFLRTVPRILARLTNSHVLDLVLYRTVSTLVPGTPLRMVRRSERR